MAKIKSAQTNIYMIDGKIKACIMIGIDDIELGKAEFKYIDDDKRKELEKAMNDALDKWEFDYQ